MLPKLIKFIVRTRFSRPFLILIGLVFLYEIGFSTFIPHSSEALIQSYYGTAIVALFLAMALATGGIMVLKSDRDYLFTLPLSTRDLSISIFFSQFIAFGITILFISIYLSPTASLFLTVDMVALAFTFTSLGILATSLNTRLRVGLSVAVALWTLAGIIGFPVSPGAAFNGNVIPGTATLVVLGALTTAAAFRGLSRVELDMMRNLVRSTSAEVKSQVSYSGKSPIGAIYAMNFSSMSLAGRMGGGMAGSSRYISRRVKTRWVVTAASIAAAAYLAFVLYQGPPVTIAAGSDSLPEAIGAAIGLAFLSFFFSQSAITNERIWLSLTSLPPSTYFRHLVGSKVASMLFILAPFAIADAALFLLGYAEALGGLIVVAAVIPSTYVLEILWAAYVAPIQVKGDDQYMAAQFNIRQMSTAVPLLAVFVLVSISTLFPLVAAIGGVLLIALASVLTLSGRFWGKVVSKLTESGFV